MEKYDQNLEYASETSTISKPINLELIFQTRVASPVYTGRTINGENFAKDGNESIKIILVDSQTRQQVTNGRVASVKVKIVLIRGDFCGVATGDDGIWTPQEFKNSIVVNLEKKKNLLLGDLSLILKDGSGTVGEIRIKHDRKNLKNVKFRLGAMVDDDCPCEIKEAISNPFDVKDRRNEPKCKGPLSPDDGVGQLMNISNKRKGPIRTRLESEKICTVRDFLNMHKSNPRLLKEICGIKGKKWEKTINHAKTSRSDNVCNVYGRVGSTSQQSNYVPSFDRDSSITFDNNCYKPQPFENDLFGNMMTVDCNFSTQDVEVCDVFFRGFEQYREYQEDGINDASATVGNGGDLAKKRWMKLRATIWMIFHEEG